MSLCPSEIIPIVEDRTFCSNLDHGLQLHQLTRALLPELTSSSVDKMKTPKKYDPNMLFTLGLISAFLSLFIIPEVFGSAAIILGAYTWRMERDGSRNRGLIVLIIGIIFMLVGIYFTSYFALIDLLP